MAVTLRDLGELVLAIIFPPLAVFLHKGVLDTDVCINILLCLLGWLPGADRPFVILCLCLCFE
jgi:uncharacterized membrane protein YqaE (UPF0057 family)